VHISEVFTIIDYWCQPLHQKLSNTPYTGHMELELEIAGIHAGIRWQL